MASPSSNTSSTAFLASVESMCKKYTAQVRKYQDEMSGGGGRGEEGPGAGAGPGRPPHRGYGDGGARAQALPEGHGVFAALKELSRYVCYEPDLNAYAYYEYELISQLLVLAWKSTVYVADIVAHLQVSASSENQHHHPFPLSLSLGLLSRPWKSGKKSRHDEKMGRSLTLGTFLSLLLPIDRSIVAARDPLHRGVAEPAPFGPSHCAGVPAGTEHFLYSPPSLCFRREKSIDQGKSDRSVQMMEK